MTTRPKPSGPPAKDSLSVELGGWFKANATGGGGKRGPDPTFPRLI